MKPTESREVCSIGNRFLYAHLKLIKPLIHIKTIDEIWHTAWGNDVAQQIVRWSSLLKQKRLLLFHLLVSWSLIWAHRFCLLQHSSDAIPFKDSLLHSTYRNLLEGLSS